jgi:hypothetical protein
MHQTNYVSIAPLLEPTVGENNIAAPKMQNKFFLHYWDILLLSI